MSTRSTLTIFKNNTYYSIYIHWDGYTKHMAPILINLTKTEIFKIIRSGNASYLSEDGEHKFYGEKYNTTETFESIQKQDFNYLYKDNKLSCTDRLGKTVSL